VTLKYKWRLTKYRIKFCWCNRPSVSLSCPTVFLFAFWDCLLLD